MTARREKTATDIHWNDRPKTHPDNRKVNIDDLVQRSLENDFILSQLWSDSKILEVGCGNGYLTQELRKYARFVDAFDFSENMIALAKETVGEDNNRFFVHSLLDPDSVDRSYDSIVCVRVLINLANVDEQKSAIENMASWLKPGGKLILVEGYADGFAGLNEIRRQCGLEDLKPAAINYYSSVAELEPVIKQHFDFSDSWHSGMFDILTRVAYPLLVGSENARGPSDFHEKIKPLTRYLNPSALAPYARLHGYALIKK